VLYDHEVGYTSFLNTHFSSPQFGPTVHQRIQTALRLFHIGSVQVPALFRHVIAITEEDASALLEFQSEAKVYVQQPGIDYGHFSASSQEYTPSKTPALVFVGSYRHTPNVEAVLYFAEHIWPEIRRRHSGARFRIVGPNPTAAIQALRDRPG